MDSQWKEAVVSIIYGLYKPLNRRLLVDMIIWYIRLSHSKNEYKQMSYSAYFYPSYSNTIAATFEMESVSLSRTAYSALLYNSCALYVYVSACQQQRDCTRFSSGAEGKRSCRNVNNLLNPWKWKPSCWQQQEDANDRMRRGRGLKVLTLLWLSCVLIDKWGQLS